MLWQTPEYSSHLQRICQQFSGKIIFHKLVQNHFPKIFCGFSNFLKIVQKLTKNFPKKYEFYEKHLAEFCNFP